MTGMIKNGLTGSEMSEIQAPQALVICPTRELANQIFYEARKFAHGTMLKACVCYGGVSVGHQLSAIERGCHFLVATPGRLLDFIGRRKVGDTECIECPIFCGQLDEENFDWRKLVAKNRFTGTI